MDDLQLAYISELNKNPHNFGTLDAPSVSHEDTNPLCGDRIRIDLELKDGIIIDVRFQGRGCSISQASASLLTDEIKGKSIDAIVKFSKDDMLELLDVPLSKNPVRIKCALLALKTLKTGLYKHLGAQIEDEDL